MQSVQLELEEETLETEKLNFIFWTGGLAISTSEKFENFVKTLKETLLREFPLFEIKLQSRKLSPFYNIFIIEGKYKGEITKEILEFPARIRECIRRVSLEIFGVEMPVEKVENPVDELTKSLEIADKIRKEDFHVLKRFYGTLGLTALIRSMEEPKEIDLKKFAAEIDFAFSYAMTYLVNTNFQLIFLPLDSFTNEFLQSKLKSVKVLKPVRDANLFVTFYFDKREDFVNYIIDVKRPPDVIANYVQIRLLMLFLEVLEEMIPFIVREITGKRLLADSKIFAYKGSLKEVERFVLQTFGIVNLYSSMFTKQFDDIQIWLYRHRGAIASKSKQYNELMLLYNSVLSKITELSNMIKYLHKVEDETKEHIRRNLEELRSIKEEMKDLGDIEAEIKARIFRIGIKTLIKSVFSK